MTPRRTAVSRLLGSAIALAVLLVAAIGMDNWGDLLGSPPQAAPSAPDARPAAQRVAQGAVLARAGNCVACHSAQGGAPLAGGRPIETPFGTVYTSNLTPDPDTGLGRWQIEDFRQALQRGRAPGGRLLIPAFPYEHTRVMTLQDMDDVWAWLQTQPPVHQPTPAHTLRWPYGTQAALAVWRSLFLSDTPWQADPARSAQWNRGAYLVQGLGHCAACHSPRNALGANGGIADLSGGRMPGQGWYAPSLVDPRETGLAEQSIEEIVALLQTGRNRSASTLGPMGEVVQHGLQHLPEADLRAMAVYLQARAQDPNAPRAAQAARRGPGDWLRSLGNAQPKPRAPEPAPAAVTALGLSVYKAHCADCHGERGEGQPGRWPPLAGNRAVLLDDPSNLMQVVMHGAYAPVTRGQPRPYGMPPYQLTLQDAELAAVLTVIRQDGLAEGPSRRQLAPQVTPLQVRQWRETDGH